jgi:hypothetical protein
MFAPLPRVSDQAYSMSVAIHDWAVAGKFFSARRSLDVVDDLADGEQLLAVAVRDLEAELVLELRG